MNLQEKLVAIQGSLKAPKNQRNNFGNYNYRSCEDILEALKPHLTKHNVTLTLSDMIYSNSILYVESCATLTCGDETISVMAQAGIDVNKKGMDIAQTFGASSSYARKYALNGLFLIDDTKDADATNTHNKVVANTSNDELEWLPESGVKFNNAKQALKSGKVTLLDIRKKYKVSKKVAELLNT